MKQVVLSHESTTKELTDFSLRKSSLIRTTRLIGSVRFFCKLRKQPCLWREMVKPDGLLISGSELAEDRFRTLCVRRVLSQGFAVGKFSDHQVLVDLFVGTQLRR